MIRCKKVSEMIAALQPQRAPKSPNHKLKKLLSGKGSFHFL